MPRDPAKYLHDMLDRACFVQQVMADKTLDDLVRDRLLRSAVERELMVLGEALYQLHRTSPTLAQRITSYEEIIGFRHVLVHGYDAISMRVIYDVISDDLPRFVNQVRDLVAESA